MQVRRRHSTRSFLLGDLLYLRIFSRSVLVLNSLEAAIDLQEKHFAIYSDRPRRVMAELLSRFNAEYGHGLIYRALL